MCLHAQSLQSCLTLCDPMDCSPPGSSVWDSPGKKTGVGCHALLQGSSLSRDRTHVSCVSCFTGGFFTSESLGKPRIKTWMTVICVNFQHLS